MTSCSVCKAPNFRTCPCPWGQAFSNWPAAAISKLRAALEASS